MRRSFNIAALIFCAIAVFLRFFLLSALPEGLHVDEAGMAYDAFSLSQFGVDRYRNSWPVYLINYGGGQSALYCYLAAFCVRLFGLSVFSVRLPGALFSLLTLFCGLRIIALGEDDEVQRARLYMVFAFLFAVAPYFFMSARFGLDCNLMLGASTLAIWMLLRAVRRGGCGRYALAGIFCGLVLYTYAISYLVLPVFLLLFFLSLLVCGKLRLREAFCFFVPLALFAAPLVLVQLINAAGRPSMKIWKITIPALLFYRSAEIVAPSPAGLFLTLKSVFLHDWLDYNSVPRFGTIYYLSLPFAAVGIAAAFVHAVGAYRRRLFGAETAVLLWFFSELLVGSMLGGDGPNSNKLNGAFFAALYFTAKGIVWVADRLPKRARRGAMTALAAAYAVCAALFFHYYYVGRPASHTPFYLFQKPLDAPIAMVQEDDALSQRRVYIVNAHQPYVQPYIYYLLATRTSPWEVDIADGGTSQIGNFSFGTPGSIDAGGVYIVLEGNDAYLEELAGEGLVNRTEFDGSTLVY